MKLPVRWMSTWVVAGGVLLSSLLSGAGSALALPEAEIAKKLSGVPVFMIARPDGDIPGRCLNRNDGKPIGCDDPNKIVVTIAFMSRQDAETVLTGLTNASPGQVNEWKIVSPSLKDVREKVRGARQQGDPMVVSFRPSRSQLNAALRVLQQQNSQAKRFQGVPLFFAVAPSGNGTQSDTFLTAQFGNQGESVIPFFFSQDDLQKKLNENPALAAKYQIRVMAFEELVRTWQNPQANEPWLDKIQLIPASPSN